MPRFLLDTSAILAHFRQEVGWELVKGIFDDPEAEVLIASLTLTELARRLAALGFSPEYIREVVAAYQSLMNETVAIDAGVAVTAFEIGRQTPGRLPLADSLVAAAASAREATLVHADEHLAVVPTAIVQQKRLR